MRLQKNPQNLSIEVELSEVVENSLKEKSVEGMCYSKTTIEFWKENKNLENSKERLGNTQVNKLETNHKFLNIHRCLKDKVELQNSHRCLKDKVLNAEKNFKEK